MARDHARIRLDNLTRDLFRMPDVWKIVREAGGLRCG